MVDKHNQISNSITVMIDDLLNHLQENYGQLMPHKIPER